MKDFDIHGNGKGLDGREREYMKSKLSEDNVGTDPTDSVRAIGIPLSGLDRVEAADCLSSRVINNKSGEMSDS